MSLLYKPSAGGNGSNTLVWETQIDWDNSQSEAGVVYEGYGTRQADQVELGYPSFDRGGSALESYYSLDETSGSTANDHTGNGNDGTINSGISLGTNGPWGTNAYDWGGSASTVDLPSEFSYNELTYSTLVYVPAYNSTWEYAIYNGSGVVLGKTGADEWIWQFGGNNLRSTTSVTAHTGEWVHLCGTYDGSNHRLYVNGNDEGSTSSGSRSAGNLRLGTSESGNEWPGRISDVRIYSRVLSASEVQALTDALTTGSLTTGVKTA